MTKTGRIVMLNGVGSAGKSSLARALQAITAEPFLHVQMDAFIEMMPPALQDHPDGFSFTAEMLDGKPQIVIATGAVGANCMNGMRHAIAAMAGQGNNLIVDDVMMGGDRAAYDALLAAFAVHWVGVFAPLDILEAREKQRGDRLIGLARWQYDRVHQGQRYDIEIDTSQASPAACAQLIKERFGL